MKIYLDLVLFLNFAFDLLLLVSVSIILRRNIPLYKLMLGAFIGSFSIFFLFIPITTLTLFIFKIVISFIMIIVSFKYRNIKYFLKNIAFFYISSVILGGFLYLLNIEFSYKQVGLVFYHNGLSINFIFLVIFSPIIIYIYVKQGKSLRNNYSKYYKVNLFLNDKKIYLNAFLDTGNKLVDPYYRKPVILVNNKLLNTKNMDYIFIPFNGVNNKGLLKCITVSKIEIEGVGIKEDILVGLLEEKIRIDGVDCILNDKLLEDI